MHPAEELEESTVGVTNETMLLNRQRSSLVGPSPGMLVSSARGYTHPRQLPERAARLDGSSEDIP